MYAIWLDTFSGQVGSISGQYTILHYICYIVSIESSVSMYKNCSRRCWRYVAIIHSTTRFKEHIKADKNKSVT